MFANNKLFRPGGGFSPGLIMLMLLASGGCETGQPVPQTISGRIVEGGKPVYPVVLLLQDEKGKSISANVKNINGEFTVVGVELGRRYTVAVEPIQLGGISQAERAAVTKAAEEAKAEGRELRREETIPAQFANAHIDFPKKFKSLESSGLVIDCTTSIPTEPVVLDLK